MIGIDLGLDIDTDLAVTRSAHEVEHLDQRWNSRSRHGVLVGKWLSVGAPRPDPADVIFPDVFKPQSDKGCAGWRRIDTIGAAGEVGIELAFVRHHHRAV